jgi:hypothetical protein
VTNQYTIIALLFVQGAPWKKSFLTNYKFTIWALVSIAASAALLLSPLMEPQFFRGDDLVIPWNWKRSILALVFLYGATAAFWDLFLSPFLGRLAKKASRRGLAQGEVFGRNKVIEGPTSKLYHRMRGEFEAGWGGGAGQFY